ncbi:MAG: YggT family protein [Treponema sp.]|nr:YggT family protein [Treponema sp.]
MNVLAGILSVYTLLVFIRLLLTWFPGSNFGGVYYFLCSVCDPYLNWFRRFRLFKNSPLDFSPLIALAVLSLAHQVLVYWGALGRISVALVLALLLGAAWSILSWVFGFFIVILILRTIAFLGNCNIYSPFWRFVDFIAQPVIYRITRIFFPRRITGYLFRLILSIAVLLILAAALWAVIRFGQGALAGAPF